MGELSIDLLDGLAVRRDGEPLALPASKKTRALLAYLVLSGRPQRRERLCELFWEQPDDPRGALRWSLSKLRRVVNESPIERLAADRERVVFVADEVVLDTQALAARLDAPALSLEELTETVERLQGTLLAGLDLPEQHGFQHWLVAERREHETLAARAALRLADDRRLGAERALYWTRLAVEAAPADPAAAARLLGRLRTLGEHREARALAFELDERFRAAGVPWPPPERETDSTDPDASEVSGQPMGARALVERERESAREAGSASDSDTTRHLLARQTIRFCSAEDGTRIAYGLVGEGPPIVKAANWLTHLELDWDAPIWSPLYRELARDHRLVRYDERGAGLSDWEVGDISFDTWVTDLETVVDALGLERFALLGISQGASVSIEYAVRHPERVSRLVLFGAYAAGWRMLDTPPDIVRQREAIVTLAASEWGRRNPGFRHIFSSTFMPSASAETLDWFDEFQRRTTSPANAARFLEAFGRIDVRERLAEVRAPTLVVHSLGDQRCPIAFAHEIAARVPGAEFVGLESDGHLLLGEEPASAVFLEAVREFLSR